VQLKSVIRQVADTAVSVCVYGETGTGKELVANAIHKLSKRRNEPFIKINCAAIPKDLLESELFGYEAGAFSGALRQGKVGMFELADGGTLLLDEIGDLPLTLQAKLLRVLQDGELRRVGGVKSIPVNVRLICSTNRNLKSMVDAGEFRADLYFRINTIELLVPPLRDRTEDIPILIDHFIQAANERNGSAVSGIRHETYPTLLAYHWPGNVRELEHTVERACVLCGSGVLGPEHFSLSAAPGKDLASSAPPSLKTKTNSLEYRAILDALETCQGNKRAAADMLKITRVTLYSKLRKYNIPL
jgi:transcriptional regulator with PAS, ATPase and Fis domain